MPLLLAVAASILGGLLTVLVAGLVLALKGRTLDRALPRLISFSTGSLLGAALLGMLPHAAKALPISSVAHALLAGLVAFFVLEKLLVWRHCHRHGCQVHAGAGPLLLLGDAFHNFVDGVVIAGAFLESTPLGAAVALSTMAHELPQELGEFMVYRREGYTWKRALFLNGASSLASVLGAIVGFFFLASMRAAGPYLLSIAAAGFLYVALADLIPAQREKTSLGYTILDMFLVASGIALIAVGTHGH